VFGLSAKKLCKSCGEVGKAGRYMPGSLIVELVCWLMFILPGIVYSIYRHSASKPCCKVCKSLEIIPLNSPMAKQLLDKKVVA